MGYLFVRSSGAIEEGGGGDGLWSNPDTWASGTVPIAGEDVTIPAGQSVILDVVTPSLGSLDIEGSLQVTGSGTYGLTVEQIHMSGDGAFLVGTSGVPFTGTMTTTFTGPRSSPANAHDRGMMLHDNARLECYGNPPTIPWTTLNASAAVSATSLTLAQTVNWAAGSEILIGSTENYEWQQSEVRTLQTDTSGTTATVSVGLTHPHYGVLQYFTDSGLSLSPGTFTPPSTPFPAHLDERAPVANLTRNIKFQGIEDSEWTTSEYGFHIMVMDRTCKTILNGVEFLRGGQSGILGRYPLHWHVLSYDIVAGTYVADVPAGNFVVTKCVVRQSGQRGMVIHSTCGVTLSDNICYDIKGHGFFLEDALERRNILTGNLAAKCQAPNVSRRLSEHEADQGAEAEGGPSGFWITNPDNTFTGNRGFDNVGAGAWLSFSAFALGISTAVSAEPDRTRLGTVDNNTFHSNKGTGFLLRGTVINPTTGAFDVNLIYQPTSTDATGGTRTPFVISRISSWKNGNGAYKNRVDTPDYQEWVTADNYGTDFVGSTLGGQLQRSAVIGYSLNDAHPDRVAPLPYYSSTIQRAGVATYHSSIAIHDNVFMHFPESIANNYGSGAFKADDLYTDAVEMGNYRNTDNILIDAFPGYFTLPPNLLGAAYQVAGRNFTFAGAFRDFNGYWGDSTKWRVYDVPFLTSGTTTTNITPSANSPFADLAIKTNGVYTDAEQYYGVQNYWTSFDPSDYNFTSHVKITRQDSGGTTIDTWEVPNGTFLSNMRHFSAIKGGRFLLEFPDHSPPSEFRMSILNCYRAGDNFLFGVEFDGATTVSSLYYASAYSGTGTARRTCTAGANLAAVSAGSGDLYWQDTGNNIVWVKVVGGLTYPSTPTPGSDADLWRAMTLFVS